MYKVLLVIFILSGSALSAEEMKDDVTDLNKIVSIMTSAFENFGKDVKNQLDEVSTTLVVLGQRIIEQNRLNSESIISLTKDIKDTKSSLSRKIINKSLSSEEDSLAMIRKLGEDFANFKLELQQRNIATKQMLDAKLDPISLVTEELDFNLRNNSEQLERFQEGINILNNSLSALNRGNKFIIENSKSEVENLVLNVTELLNSNFEKFNTFDENLNEINSAVSEGIENSDELHRNNSERLDKFNEFITAGFRNNDEILAESVNRLEKIESALKEFRETNNATISENIDLLRTFSEDVQKSFVNNSDSLESITSSVNRMKEEFTVTKDIKLILIDVQHKVIDMLTKIETSLNQTSRRYRDCADVIKDGHRQNGVYRIWPFGGKTEFDVYCDMKTEAGGWTVFQRRGDFGFPQDFFSKSWQDFKIGFGDLEKEFWLGNDFISSMTIHGGYQLRVDLWDKDGSYVFAKFDSFVVENEEQLYKLHVTGYTGSAGDSLSHHNGSPFSTEDRDNDNDNNRHCAKIFGGGWWFNKCLASNLNGKNIGGANENEGEGITWRHWKGTRISLYSTEMKIRSKNF